MKTKFCIAALLIACTLFACKKKRQDNEPIAPTETVHAVGRDGYVATYWINGKPTILGTTTGSSDATAIALQQSDVHISGYQITTNGKYVAMYWKNGVAQNLSDGSKDAMANDIFLSGNDVYIAGQETNGQTANWTAKYWKNGIAVVLSAPGENAVATGITVIGSDVYVIGTRRESSWLTPVTCYWKNGQVRDLSDRSTAPAYQAITQSQGLVHMSWSVSYNSQGQSRSFYSRNLSAPVLISDQTNDATAHNLAVSGSDIYLAGWGTATNSTNIQAKYWKNGNPIILESNQKSAFVLAIFVQGTDVYAAGYKENPQSGSSSLATYWKNGTSVPLTNGQSDALLRDIIVVPVVAN